MHPRREQPPSTTSMMTAVGRGLHRLRHAAPWVLDDPYALSLVGPGWPELHARFSAVVREPLEDAAIAFVSARSRYVEDRLVDGGFEQYVILGAGLDSFAWRRPDLLRTVRVIEIDHPATQAWKTRRAAELALPTSSHHVFAPVDFQRDTLSQALDAAGFDWSRPALFSWLGVVPYLTLDAVESTLRTITRCAPGTAIALTYWPTREHLDAHGREFVEIFTAVAASSDEPIQLPLDPAEIEAALTRCGLAVDQHLASDDLYDRYFADRTDDIRPYTVERLLTAVVPSGEGHLLVRDQVRLAFAGWGADGEQGRGESPGNRGVSHPL